MEMTLEHIGNDRRMGSRNAFSLVELLVVISIMATMMALSGPAIQALTGAGSVNKAVADLSGTMRLARAYAMANNTYVRVGIAEVPGMGNGTDMVVMAIYSSDGSLDQDESADMADSGKWPMLTKPLVLPSLTLSQGLNASTPDTTSDETPWSPNNDIPTFNRLVRGLTGSALTFDDTIQFHPNGEVRASRSLAARHIKIPVDRSGGATGQNSFIVRISGMNGTVDVVRVGEGI